MERVRVLLVLLDNYPVVNCSSPTVVDKMRGNRGNKRNYHTTGNKPQQANKSNSESNAGESSSQDGRDVISHVISPPENGAVNSLGNENETCGHCKNIVNDNQNALQCDRCNLWYHCRCLKISNERYAALMVVGEVEGVVWLCECCRHGFFQVHDRIDQLEKSMRDMKEDLLKALKDKKENPQSITSVSRSEIQNMINDGVREFLEE